MLGLAVSSVTARNSKTRKLDNGVLVEQVTADSPAEKAGLETGDIIVSVNNQPITSAAELKTALQAAPAGKPIAMLIMQGNRRALLRSVNLKRNTLFLAHSKHFPPSADTHP